MLSAQLGIIIKRVLISINGVVLWSGCRTKCSYLLFEVVENHRTPRNILLYGADLDFIRFFTILLTLCECIFFSLLPRKATTKQSSSVQSLSLMIASKYVIIRGKIIKSSTPHDLFIYFSSQMTSKLLTVRAHVTL